jgi:hypothetical protein
MEEKSPNSNDNKYEESFPLVRIYDLPAMMGESAENIGERPPLEHVLTNEDYLLLFRFIA